MMYRQPAPPIEPEPERQPIIGIEEFTNTLGQRVKLQLYTPNRGYDKEGRVWRRIVSPTFQRWCVEYSLWDPQGRWDPDQEPEPGLFRRVWNWLWELGGDI